MKRRKKVKDKEKRPKINSKRKDFIVNTVHERIMTYKKERPFVLKERASELKKWIEEQPEVESVRLVSDSNITVEFKDKTRVGILLNRKEMYGGGGHDEGEEGANFVMYRRLPLSEGEGDPHPACKRACVIDTLYDDWPPQSTPDDIVTMLENAGYEVDFVKNNAANLSFFASLDNKEYGVVFIRSHGDMMNVDGDDKINIMVRPFFASFPSASGYTGVEAFMVSTDCLAQGWAYVRAFNNLFVNKYMNNKYFPNTLFHLLVCHGADPDGQNDMIQSLLDKGVGCYSGWTKNATPTHGDPAAVQFFQVLCNSAANPANTVNNAITQITNAGHSPDALSGAVLVSHGSSSMQIIKCFIIKEVSKILIKNAAGQIIEKGFHDILDAVEFANNQIIGGKHTKLKIYHTVDLKKDQW